MIPYTSVDREAIWAAIYAWLKSKLWAPLWQLSTAYVTGDVRVDRYGHLQRALNDGTSGTAEPAWNNAGGTTTDNPGVAQIVWQDTGAGVVSIGRKHKMPPDLVRAEQPALFVVQVMESHNPKPAGVPTRLVLDGFLILYLQGSAATEDIGAEQRLAATDLNLLFKALDDAFQPDTLNGKFTLGGLATHCWLDGETRQDPGILGTQASAILPLHILVP